MYFEAVSEQGSRASIARSEIVGNRLAGLTVIDSEASVQASRIAETRPQESDGSYGDGVALLATEGRRASLALREVRVVRNARGGLTSFAGLASIAASTLECNPIQLHGEPWAGQTYQLVDEGENVCGCEGTTTKCAVQSATLAPPPAVEAPEPTW
jgi:hypothetical protein